MEATQCVQNGWECNSVRDPDSASQLRTFLQQHAFQTLVAWAKSAGWAARYYQRTPAETDGSYKQRLVAMLSQDLDVVGYDERGRVPDDSAVSAAYVAQHGCPADMYASPTYGMCVKCPFGKAAAAGATQESDCETSSIFGEKTDPIRRPETTGTPFPDCFATQECELVPVDVELPPAGSEPQPQMAVLVKQPSLPPPPAEGGAAYHPEQNRSEPAAVSSTWQVYIPLGPEKGQV